MKGPRLFDSAAFRSHEDNETVVKEKLYLDKANPDILRNEITTNDHALTRPWTVSRFYKREHNPQLRGIQLHRGQSLGRDRRRTYLADSEGYLMPIQKDQAARTRNSSEIFSAGEEVILACPPGEGGRPLR